MWIARKLEEYPYPVAFVVTGAAVALQYGSAHLLGETLSFLFLSCAIVLSCWLGGAGAGLFSTILAVAAASLTMVEPLASFSQKSIAGRAQLMYLAVEGVLICTLFRYLLDRQKGLSESLEASEAARDRAEESDRMKRAFIANMSHELRGPLSSVLGYIDLLGNANLTATERDSYRERLKFNAATLTHLVTDLLDVTEIESSQFVANRKKIGLADFMQNAYSTFARQAQEKNLKFQLHLRGSIPAYVESDPDQLMQILKHLIGNAIHFTESGLVKLTVTAVKTANNRREVAWIVTDQGPGIPPELRSQMFKPLAANGTAPKGGGGMGLILARKLARGLGGDVKLAKSTRRGTTFLITFDGGPADLASEFLDKLQVSMPSSPISPEDPHALDHTKALVIDDSPDSALLVGRMLKVAGAEVDTADRGQLGIDKAMCGNFDVVLMDIQMPEMDGNEAIRRLRSLGFQKPIIALSAHAMKEDREETRKSGADHYLTKPVSRRALLETVGRYTRTEPSGRALETIQLDLSPAL